MRNKPNFNKAKIVAYKALQQHNISDFPIDLLTILKSYDDISIISYSEMANRRECSLEEIIEVNSSEDGSIHYFPKKNKYLIAYNDAVGYEQRVYWTLAHEFGHYLLGHHKESNRSNLARNEMTEEEYETFEIEAHFFARFFLSPPPLIVQTKMSDHQKVMDFFGISYTSAKKTLEYIDISLKKGFNFRFPPWIRNLFHSFLNKVHQGKTCVDCGGFFYIEGASYCPICGSSDLHTLFIGDDINMKYKGYQLNENGRALICPQCENDELHIEGDYCNVCGVYTVNKCAPTQRAIPNGFDYVEDSCELILDGNARYCHKCGNESTFFQQELLQDWTEEKDEQQNKSTVFPLTVNYNNS